MHMHGAACDGTLQKALIRKFPFVAQCWEEAHLTDVFA